MGSLDSESALGHFLILCEPYVMPILVKVEILLNDFHLAQIPTWTKFAFHILLTLTTTYLITLTYVTTTGLGPKYFFWNRILKVEVESWKSGLFCNFGNRKSYKIRYTLQKRQTGVQNKSPSQLVYAFGIIPIIIPFIKNHKQFLKFWNLNLGSL